MKWLKHLLKKKKKPVELPQLSKKEARYAREMQCMANRDTGFNAIDVGEAYNFHTDCGYR